MKLISSLYSCIRSNNTYNSWSLSNYKKVSSKDFDYLLSLLISNPINLWQPSLCLKTIIFWIKICVLPSYSVQKKQTNKNNNTNNQNKNKKKGAKFYLTRNREKCFAALKSLLAFCWQVWIVPTTFLLVNREQRIISSLASISLLFENFFNVRTKGPLRWQGLLIHFDNTVWLRSKF